jgi:hypothetical protein
MNSAWGRGGGGFGSGRGAGGGGWRHRHWYYATGVPGRQRTFTDWPGYAPPFPGAFGPTVTREQELEGLKNQAEHFERVLDDLRNRIKDLESTAEDTKST